MSPLSQWPEADRRQILGVFTDIDDTLTTDGVVPPATVQALADLKAAGLHVIPITGRPVGWSEPFARDWPVDAIVAVQGRIRYVPPLGVGGHFLPVLLQPFGKGLIRAGRTAIGERGIGSDRLGGHG